MVLSAQPHQGNMPWHEYQCRLCVSYKKLNQVTRPFAISIPYLDDAVNYIDTEESYFVDVSMDNGYW